MSTFQLNMKDAIVYYDLCHGVHSKTLMEHLWANVRERKMICVLRLASVVARQ